MKDSLTYGEWTTQSLSSHPNRQTPSVNLYLAEGVFVVKTYMDIL